MNQRSDWDDEIVFALGAGLAVMLAAGYCSARCLSRSGPSRRAIRGSPGSPTRSPSR